MNYVSLKGLMLSIRKDSAYISCGFSRSALTDFISSLDLEVMFSHMATFFKRSKDANKKK